MHALLAVGLSFLVPAVQNDDNLGALVEVLKSVDDADFQRDILKGLHEGLKGRRNVKMPKAWPEVSEKLSRSPNAEVRELARKVATAFGDPSAFAALRAVVTDPKAPMEKRLEAMDTLVTAGDKGLAKALPGLLKDEGIRGPALKAMAGYEDASFPDHILQAYGSLTVEQRRDAINTLCARPSFAHKLLAALDGGAIPKEDITAFSVRQLGAHGDKTIDAWIDKAWGAVRATPEARLREIEAMKKMLLKGKKGDPSRGRAVFAKTCRQCHTLYGDGGKVGPDLTGSNRANLDYILHNIMDPSAEVGKDYQAYVIRTKAGRILTGLVAQRGGGALTVTTENDTLILGKDDIDKMKKSEVSMMPEGLVKQISHQQLRDLVAYMATSSQVPIAQEEGEVMFNGKDLTGWEGDASVWSVEDGEIVGRGPQKKNQFLYYMKKVSDFRVIFEVKLVPDSGNSGFQFRSQKLPDGHAKGYQADIGKGWWGKIYHEHGRKLLVTQGAADHVKRNDWNTYEILAVGNKIRIAINGHMCADFTDDKADPKTDMEGYLAPQVHSGGKQEVRFRNFRLERNPKDFELKTVTR